ncbi:putative rhamnosyl transferase [Salipiger mucosus]|uniref:Rhamnosyl transferase n=1 Tax=Salipiger mucosus DSM 16094 TaxID=1123237 RepID=S9R4K7_9RHOB|nr:putative rhamnosyl transferase [Salipiger mucosus]EPX86862.1 hypothetical protein Salmuc_01513 [Salipiger mucosus DSM 16094]
MQAIGLCRFSWPAEGGFQVEHASIAERRAYLYSKARMEQRFRTFEAITLPGLRGQTDPDFTFVLLIDEALPEAHAERLLALVADLPQAVVVARPPGPHRATCREVLNAARHDPAAPCLQFRLDDDDTVARDFIARIRADAAMLEGLRSRNRLVTLDYNRGYILRPSAEGLHGEETVLNSYPMGMAMCLQGGVTQSIMNFAHGKVARFMPVVSFTDSAMFVRGHSDFNDSRQSSRARPVDLPPASPETLAVLRERFGITADHVRSVFA